jgi:SH3 domain protein
MKKIILSLIIACFLPMSAVAESAYISDQIEIIWTRTGPTKEYRFSFQLAPGAKFEILQENQETGYVEIKDERGRIGWLENKYITKNPTANRLLSAAKNEIVELKKNYQESLSSLEKRIKVLEPLQQTNDALQNELAKLETNYEVISQENQAHKNRFLREVFFAGAVVFFAGFIFGWIVSRVTGNKRGSGWS